MRSRSPLTAPSRGGGELQVFVGVRGGRGGGGGVVVMDFDATTIWFWFRWFAVLLWQMEF